LLFSAVTPGIHPVAAARPFTLAPDESPDIMEEVRKVIGALADPERWLDTPHWWFRYQKPREVIGTEDEKELRYLLRNIKYGVPT
jgi:hypothetical protein